MCDVLIPCGAENKTEPKEQMLPAGEAIRLEAAGDAGDDGELVGIGDGGFFLGGKIANVVVVEVDVDEGAELAFGGVEVVLQGRMRGGESGEAGGDGGGFDGDSLLLVGVSAQRGGDVDLHDVIISKSRE
jgi:hypothetical protein